MNQTPGPSANPFAAAGPAPAATGNGGVDHGSHHHHHDHGHGHGHYAYADPYGQYAQPPAHQQQQQQQYSYQQQQQQQHYAADPQQQPFHYDPASVAYEQQPAYSQQPLEQPAMGFAYGGGSEYGHYQQQHDPAVHLPLSEPYAASSGYYPAEPPSASSAAYHAPRQMPPVALPPPSSSSYNDYAPVQPQQSPYGTPGNTPSPHHGHHPPSYPQSQQQPTHHHHNPHHAHLYQSGQFAPQHPQQQHHASSGGPAPTIASRRRSISAPSALDTALANMAAAPALAQQQQHPAQTQLVHGIPTAVSNSGGDAYAAHHHQQNQYPLEANAILGVGGRGGPFSGGASVTIPSNSISPPPPPASMLVGHAALNGGGVPVATSGPSPPRAAIAAALASTPTPSSSAGYGRAVPLGFGPAEGLVLKTGMAEKPPYPLSTVIAYGIATSTTRRLTLAEIYEWMLATFPYYRTATTNWRNTVRHTLSMNKAFVKIEKSINEYGKGCYWSVDPNLADKVLKRARRSSDPYRGTAGSTGGIGSPVRERRYRATSKQQQAAIVNDATEAAAAAAAAAAGSSGGGSFTTAAASSSSSTSKSKAPSRGTPLRQMIRRPSENPNDTIAAATAAAVAAAAATAASGSAPNLAYDQQMYSQPGSVHSATNSSASPQPSGGFPPQHPHSQSLPRHNSQSLPRQQPYSSSSLPRPGTGGLSAGTSHEELLQHHHMLAYRSSTASSFSGSYPGTASGSLSTSTSFDSLASMGSSSSVVSGHIVMGDGRVGAADPLLGADFERLFADAEFIPHAADVLTATSGSTGASTFVSAPGTAAASTPTWLTTSAPPSAFNVAAASGIALDPLPAFPMSSSMAGTGTGTANGVVSSVPMHFDAAAAAAMPTWAAPDAYLTTAAGAAPTSSAAMSLGLWPADGTSSSNSGYPLLPSSTTPDRTGDSLLFASAAAAPSTVTSLPPLDLHTHSHSPPAGYLSLQPSTALPPAGAVAAAAAAASGPGNPASAFPTTGPGSVPDWAATAGDVGQRP
ncbi:hypothetical protein H9P43_002700 [Blastocladiella emersonii ATCC 22665]|nr:hypothetical protein H9P43_002700 [Blastocladiella emersonii ATCC 22665]